MLQNSIQESGLSGVPGVQTHGHAWQHFGETHSGNVAFVEVVLCEVSHQVNVIADHLLCGF